jgi:hypothetical protein
VYGSCTGHHFDDPVKGYGLRLTVAGAAVERIEEGEHDPHRADVGPVGGEHLIGGEVGVDVVVGLGEVALDAEVDRQVRHAAHQRHRRGAIERALQLPRGGDLKRFVYRWSGLKAVLLPPMQLITPSLSAVRYARRWLSPGATALCVAKNACP